MRRLRFNVCLLLAAPAVLVPAAAAQRWHPAARVRAEFRADDNIFLLDADNRPRPAAPSPGDVASGRFRDMENAADLIAVPSLELGIEGDGLGGRPLSISADVAYEVNVRNAARRHAELEVTVEQRVRRGGDLRLSVDFRPSYFHKNYLRDAVDLDADDNIAADERIYTRGTSREVDLGLRYRQRVRSMHTTLSLGVGYLDRRYDGPFAGRSRSGPDFGADVAVAVGPVVTLGAGYRVASLAGDPGPAILILDENEFGVDFNGNLTTTDTAARAAVTLNYSRVERQFEASFRAEAGAAIVIVEYGRRTRSFDSTEPFDVVNRDRRDVLDEITVDVELRLRAGARLAAGVRRGAQTTNRAGDPASSGDVADYTRHVAWAGVRYRF